MFQLSLFGPNGDEPEEKPPYHATELRVLVTVKAAPNPSHKYGETVCVAGVRAEWNRPGWIRLYPINFRALPPDKQFQKYDIIALQATPATNDQRRESWCPNLETLRRVRHLNRWRERRAWLDPYVSDSMCAFNEAARQRQDAPSLGLVTPRDISQLALAPHPGWTPDQQRKIDAYVRQGDLFHRPRKPLAPPRFRGTYHYRCHAPRCRGHRQTILDWEFVALQHRHPGLSDSELRGVLEEKFFAILCDPARDVAFYIGNQAKRVQDFSVLGLYYPDR